eukprot:12922362-Prorocentrum_lima.AAC.1
MIQPVEVRWPSISPNSVDKDKAVIMLSGAVDVSQTKAMTIHPSSPFLRLPVVEKERVETPGARHPM